MYEIIKKFLNDGGKCLLIEDSKPIGVVLTVEEYEKLQKGLETQNPNSEIKEEDSAIKPAETVASAEIADIEAADDVTLGDLGIDELPY